MVKEPFYIVSASLEIGDFYYLRKDFDNAYKYFIEAYKVAKTSFTQDNLTKVDSRIVDLQKRMKEDDFSKLQEKYGK